MTLLSALGPHGSAVLLLALASLPTLAIAAGVHPQLSVQRASASGWPIDAFTLTDQRGEPFTHEQLMKRWTFVVFDDTGCAAPCADALTALDGVLQRIARAQVRLVTQVLLVSRDDRPPRADRRRRDRGPQGAAFVVAAGPASVVERLADDWRIDAEVAPAPPGSVLLVGPDGIVRARYAPPFDAALLTADFLRTRAKGRPR